MKKFNEWLEFDQTFENPGKQGLVGLLKPTKNIKDNKDPKFVFKISQYINYLVQHEYTVMTLISKTKNKKKGMAIIHQIGQAVQSATGMSNINARDSLMGKGLPKGSSSMI